MAERDDTYSTLLTTAVRLFGQHGYDGVTTRMLADAAGANVAGINKGYGKGETSSDSRIDCIASGTQNILADLGAVAVRYCNRCGTGSRFCLSLGGLPRLLLDRWIAGG